MKASLGQSILVTWENGPDWRHLMRLKPIVERLAERGHRLTLVARDLSQTQKVFPDLACLQPPQQPRPVRAHPQAGSLAEIMLNSGFDNSATVKRLCAAWQAIGELVRPDAVVMSFSPVALLAFQGQPIRQVLIDDGYSHPMASGRMPSLKPWQRRYADQQTGIESRVRKAVNDVLLEAGQPPIDELSELFQRVDSINLMTLPELDHSGPKAHAHYRGFSDPGGAPPPWPGPATRPRLFVYLRPFAGIGELLSRIGQLDWSILAIVPGHDPQLRERLSNRPNLHLTETPCDIYRAAREAQLGISAGGDTVGIMLLGATPVCIVPYHVEQYLSAWRAEKTGAAICAGTPARLPPRTEEIITALNQLAQNRDCRQQAGAFAARYQALDPEHELAAVVAEIEGGSPDCP